MISTYSCPEADRFIRRNRELYKKAMTPKPWGRLVGHPRLGSRTGSKTLDALQNVQASGTTGTWAELMFQSTADFTAVASTNSEATLLAGVNEQPTIPALYFFNKQGKYRAIKLRGAGVFSTTSTPTMIFQVRSSTTQGSSTLSGASLGVSAAITTGSGVTNARFWFELDLVCTIGGQGSGNSTLSGSGYVASPAGFASPFMYDLEPTTPNTATWTATFDGALTQYLNVSLTWSASSSSNTCVLKQLQLFGFN
jgi:hypothetical protein